MSVRCYNCATGFGILNKEIGCKKCGYAFCKKCVTKKVTLPNHSKQALVCDKCYDVISGKKIAPVQYSPPEALAKRMAAAEKGSSGHVSTPVGSRPSNQQHRGMTSEDIELAKRLEKLKQERLAGAPPVASQNEIEARLSKLKGAPPVASQNEIEARLSKLKGAPPVASQNEIEARLSKLKGAPPVASQNEIEARLSKLKGAPPVASQNEIEARLSKLKERQSGQPAPSDKEMADRLAVMRGQNPSTVNQPFIYRADNRSAQEQIDSLLEETSGQVDLDTRLQAQRVRSIEERLGRLKGATPGSADNQGQDNPNPELQNNLNTQPASKPYSDKLKNWNIAPEGEGSEKDSDWLEVKKLMEGVASDLDTDASKAVNELKKDKELWKRVTEAKISRKGNTNSAADDNADDDDDDDDSEDDDAAARSVCKQILAEMRLEESLGPVPETTDKNNERAQKIGKSGDTSTKEEEKELPWCCICNEDAVLRCKACDNDLYCERCFKEGHNKYDLKDGHAKNYLKKK